MPENPDACKAKGQKKARRPCGYGLNPILESWRRQVNYNEPELPSLLLFRDNSYTFPL